jgi:hypothetical protein
LPLKGTCLPEKCRALVLIREVAPLIPLLLGI